jgi:Spy/CpxP family protein refolding chaperone
MITRIFFVILVLSFAGALYAQEKPKQYKVKGEGKSAPEKAGAAKGECPMAGGGKMSCSMQCMGHHNIIPCMIKLKDKVGLKDDQVKKLEGINRKVKKQQIQNDADMKKLRIDLRHLIHADKPDAAKIDAKIDESGKLCSSALKHRIHAKLDARKILTAGQLKKFDGLHKGKCPKCFCGPGKKKGGMRGNKRKKKAE